MYVYIYIYIYIYIERERERCIVCVLIRLLDSDKHACRAAARGGAARPCRRAAPHMRNLLGWLRLGWLSYLKYTKHNLDYLKLV